MLAERSLSLANNTRAHQLEALLLALSDDASQRLETS